MRAWRFTLGIALFVILVCGQSAQASAPVNVYFFWGQGCPHCAKAKAFLQTISSTDVRVHDYEVWYSAENVQLLQDVGAALNVSVAGVPFTVIGEQSFSGYYTDETTGAEMQRAIGLCASRGCTDPVAALAGVEPTSPDTSSRLDSDETEDTGTSSKTVHLPLVGTLNTEHLSLPILTVIIAALDGFNPCAMWTLLFLIGLLVGMHDRRRMWVLGSAFIGASAFVYFLFLAAWLNLLQFLGAMVWVRAIIGVIALGGGGYYLKEFFTHRDATCKVTGQAQRRRLLDRLRQYAQARSFWLALGGIILLAMAVNLVELVCSAGLPAVYTQVLALSDLPQWQYYAYLLLYIVVFLLDDLFVFFVAMKTLQVTGLTSTYARASHLIGGAVMLIIGLLLIFKPEVLMFG